MPPSRRQHFVTWVFLARKCLALKMYRLGSVAPGIFLCQERRHLFVCRSTGIHRILQRCNTGVRFLHYLGFFAFSLTQLGCQLSLLIPAPLTSDPFLILISRNRRGTRWQWPEVAKVITDMLNCIHISMVEGRVILPSPTKSELNP